MSLDTKIGEHLLCVAIDLAEAHQELKDADIKVRNLSLKYNQLIDIKEKLDHERSSNNTNISNLPTFLDSSHYEG
tara:strand:+ start:1146 stop:1370 length:225 start_codon:yes stop_codon:yes gene_type:complete